MVAQRTGQEAALQLEEGSTGGPTDSELMARVAGGEQSAFAQLYDRYGGIAYGLALQITGEPAQAQDVVQDAFLACWRQAAGFKAQRGSVRGWLLAIVHHRAVDLLRSARQQRETYGAAERLTEVPDEQSVEQEALHRMDMRHVGAALRTLPAPQRQVVEMAYYRGYPYPEIASQLGLPLGTVKSRLRLALARLSCALGTQRDSPRLATENR